MPHINPDAEAIRELLQNAKTIAMVGASSRPERASYEVMARLMAAGYDVIPVNPRERAVHGVPAVGSLLDVKKPIDIVDVFRRPEHTPDIARQAVRIGAHALWLQQGVVNEHAAAIASAAGLVVVMDACIAVALSSLLLLA